MYCNLKVTKLGNYYKITSINLKTSSSAVAKIKRVSCDNKLENNLIRAKNTITDIALTNDFDYFFTLTFNPLYDRFNLDVIMADFRQFLRFMRSKYNADIKYLVVPEQHKNGAWHLHGFFNKDIEKCIYINEYGYLSVNHLDKLGFMNIQVINDKVRVASYVTKYISKNLGDGIKKFNHSFYSSIGLKRGEEIKSVLYDNEYFNNVFYEWHNDYCYRKIISSEEYEKIKSMLDYL